MTDNHEHIVRKLQKMKAKADSAAQLGSINEAEAFQAAMQRLMSQYRLTMSDIAYKEYDEDPIGQTGVDGQSMGVGNKAKRCAWIEQLSNAVARAYNCRILVHQGFNCITLVGRERDREVAEAMVTALVESAWRLSQTAYDSYYYEMQALGTLYRARGYRASWLNGFVSAITKRVYDEIAAEKSAAQSDSTALMRINTALSRVDKYMDEFGKADQLRDGPDFNPAGRQDGYEAGSNVSMNDKAVNQGNNQKKIGAQ